MLAVMEVKAEEVGEGDEEEEGEEEEEDAGGTA